ncbi:hypothetical protein TIFTF001_021036 [Ficus carica]|uniref:Uncharacterized protein n=1 Tax=Ficus carica TaxID=3494 RepID=A0AA88DJQ5_FICCA|nr:hypothetical protein TIFTF001_021036 [Ficus carica]
MINYIDRILVDKTIYVIGGNWVVEVELLQDLPDVEEPRTTTNYVIYALLFPTTSILLSRAHLYQDSDHLVHTSIPKAGKPEIGQMLPLKSGPKKGKRLRNPNPHALDREREPLAEFTSTMAKGGGGIGRLGLVDSKGGVSGWVLSFVGGGLSLTTATEVGSMTAKEGILSWVEFGGWGV